MSEPPTPRRGFPLAGLFVLLAAAAVLSAVVAPVVRLLADGGLDSGAVLGTVIGFAITAGVIAFIVRLFTSLSPRELFFATAAGAAVGALGGAVIWIPAAEIGFVFVTVCLGSAAVVIAAAIGRPRERE